jgi:hypothetical protein
VQFQPNPAPRSQKTKNCDAKCDAKTRRKIKNCQCFHFVLDDDNWKFVEIFDTSITVQNKSDMPK